MSGTAAPLADARSNATDTPAFIELQLPVSRLSKESYKERKANAGQTLTALGSYWKGRKPLILVRAAILGLLLPATGAPERDRAIFLKLMLMDEAGLRKRKAKAIPAARAKELLPEYLHPEAFDPDTGGWSRRLARERRAELELLAFKAMGLDEKLTFCLRPEELPDSALDDIWSEVSAHLGTSAESLPELVRQLGLRRFGHAPRVGDPFCGGGSIPFEAARLGCNVYAADLNPIACLLTWGALNIVGGDDETRGRITEAQKDIVAAVDRQIVELGFEHDAGPLDLKLPMDAPSRWLPDAAAKRFRIEIDTEATEAEIAAAQEAGTVKDRSLQYELDGKEQATLLDAIRGDVELKSRYSSEEQRERDRERLDACRNRYSPTAGNELRRWGSKDIRPRPDDVLQERLYCIQWSRPDGSFFYAGVTEADEQRERAVGDLVAARLPEWQSAGLVPDAVIEPGDKTDEPIRTRGWTYWHHLFGPRHLLMGALVLQHASDLFTPALRMGAAVAFCRALTWMSRLTRWNIGYEGDSGVAPSADTVKDVFYNQALNTFFNFGSRSFPTIEEGFAPVTKGFRIAVPTNVEVAPAGNTSILCDIWITDPPYADAIQYHEITEYFLAWLRRNPPRADWGWDSRRELAIKGKDEKFREAMIEAYSAMARNMSEHGVQVVMFTHQDVGVWADLAEILWAAGLQVTAGWCIATETERAFAAGNYVQGTVLLVLRRRTGEERGYLARLQAAGRRSGPGAARNDARVRRQGAAQFRGCRLPARRICGGPEGSDALFGYRRQAGGGAGRLRW
jgi:putative DNA methylase